jgi:hypothetical protein
MLLLTKMIKEWNFLANCRQTMYVYDCENEKVFKLET